VRVLYTRHVSSSSYYMYHCILLLMYYTKVTILSTFQNLYREADGAPRTQGSLPPQATVPTCHVPYTHNSTEQLCFCTHVHRFIHACKHIHAQYTHKHTYTHVIRTDEWMIHFCTHASVWMIHWFTRLVLVCTWMIHYANDTLLYTRVYIYVYVNDT
jgi:hypothetical protein